MKSFEGKVDLRDGFTLYLDKPLTWSSFSLVNKFRYEACVHIGIKKLKVGHAGTLDPLATGVMILCTGKNTKQIEELQKGTKEYIAGIRLGATTPTFDLESEADEYYPTEHITEELVRDKIKTFVGEIDQVPPIFSACKVDGKRAYDLARQGEEVTLKSKRIIIHEIELLSYKQNELLLRVVCGKGTYIRSLARDLGKALGSGGHLCSLERTQVGEARIENCIKLEDLPKWLEQHVVKSTCNERK